jgi:hypothetical protein
VVGADAVITRLSTVRPVRPVWPVTQIANTALTVCSVETQAEHPELFHYTRPAAFESIIKTNTFWASHYEDMVDKKEVLLLREPLIAALAPRYDALISCFDRTTRRLYKKGGSGMAVARDLVDVLYKSTFKNKGGFTALDAFMTSFSTHSGDTPFEREHGLYSQWQEYAGDNGFCIVFDTVALGQLLGRNIDARYWVHLSLRPVCYAFEGVPIDAIFPELVNSAGDTLRQCLDGSPHEIGLPEFLVGSSLLKEPRYKEEREVRIIAIPGTRPLSDQASKEHADFNVQPLPQIRTRPDGSHRRYVSIFDGLSDASLPIKRVIVGPSPRQAANAEYARSVIGNIPVFCSQCLPK